MTDTLWESPPDPRKPIVLVIDGNLAVLDSLAETLNSLDADVIRVEWGGKAHALLDTLNPAVVILSMWPENLDGIEVLRKLRKGDPNRRILVTVASGTKIGYGQLLQLYAEGVAEIVEKPIVPEILRAKVRTFLKLYGLAKCFADIRLGHDRDAFRHAEPEG